MRQHPYKQGTTDMTKTQKQEVAAAIREALHEIHRINNAAGRPVFNPAAREALCEALEVFEG